jgi:methylenetetrahydrofolate dehydrogenase (NADP+) / methenyltetrahydrofolate cyclohydrolase / formyltetrahydrofolate synthetase
VNPRFQPQLAVIQAGNRPDSSTYIRMKAKAAGVAGIKVNHITIPEDTSVQDTVDIVQRLNNDDQVTGILVQLPLGSHVGPEGEQTVTQSVCLEKDVDGCFLSNFFFYY